jgi:hypothetical protein
MRGIFDFSLREPSTAFFSAPSSPHDRDRHLRSHDATDRTVT